MSARRRTAFTLTEMLVVISIIGVLASMLLPAVQAAREAARRATCTNNLRRCAGGISSYDAAKGFLPPSRTYSSVSSKVLNWPYAILPQLEQDALYTQLKANGTLPNVKARVEVLVCPSDNRLHDLFPLSYVVNGGVENTAQCNEDYIETNRVVTANGVFVDKGLMQPFPAACTSPVNKAKLILDAKHALADIAQHDGTSTTIMLAENSDVDQWVSAPSEQYAQILWPLGGSPPGSPPVELNQDQDPVSFDINHARPASLHPGGFNVAFCDGRVAFVSERITYKVFCVLMTSHGAKAKDPSNLNAVTWQDPNDASYPGATY